MTLVMTEADLQRSVIICAREMGWLAYNTYRSMRSEPGFPGIPCCDRVVTCH